MLFTTALLKSNQRQQKATQNQQITTNIISHNSCRETQIKTQNETIYYISELEKRDN